MVEIECLLCEKPIKLPRHIDTEDYDGDVVCQECKSLLYIKLVKSKLLKYRFKEKGFRELSGELLEPGVVAHLMQLFAQKRKELLAEEGKQEEK